MDFLFCFVFRAYIFMTEFCEYSLHQFFSYFSSVSVALADFLVCLTLLELASFWVVFIYFLPSLFCLAFVSFFLFLFMKACKHAFIKK